MKIKDKRGAELAISTIILLVIGIIVLIGIVSILVMGWDDFSTAIGAAFGDDLSKAKRNCIVACAAGNVETYCADVTVGTVTYADCNDKAINPVDCDDITCPAG